MQKLNISTFTPVKKAYTEGIYSDSPTNRKLGRVGMTYTAYAAKVHQKKLEGEQKESEITNGKNKKEKLPFERKSEYYRKKNFGNFKTGDVIYLESNHKVPAGNYKIKYSGPMFPQNKDSIKVVDLIGNDGTVTRFSWDYLMGFDPFEGFKPMDLNHQLQNEAKQVKEALNKEDKNGKEKNA